MSLELSAHAYESELKKARREFKNCVESLEASHIPIFIWQRCAKCGKHRSKPACICDNSFTFFFDAWACEVFNSKEALERACEESVCSKMASLCSDNEKTPSQRQFEVSQLMVFTSQRQLLYFNRMHEEIMKLQGPLWLIEFASFTYQAYQLSPAKKL